MNRATLGDVPLWLAAQMSGIRSTWNFTKAGERGRHDY
jgi:hypothetical protein